MTHFCNRSIFSRYPGTISVQWVPHELHSLVNFVHKKVQRLARMPLHSAVSQNRSEERSRYQCLSNTLSGGLKLSLGRQLGTPSLSGTKFAGPYPYRHKIWDQIHTLTGTNPQKGYPLWHNWCSKMVHWHNYWHVAPKPTLSGTLLENPTLCGTAVNGMTPLPRVAYSPVVW